jgi:hypothetical protein
MSVIVFTTEKQAEIAAAIQHARANVVPWEMLRDIAMLDSKPTLDLKDRRNTHIQRPPSIRIVFDGGVEAAISFEEQPAGIFRHLSVSTRDGRNLLHPIAFQMVAKEFGIDIDISGKGDPLCGRPGKMWREEFEPGRYAANVIVLEVERTGPETRQ